ncbi:hypothetical protein HMPREF3016_04210 [Rothia sp. HMSC065D02]|nr:hypothetical protein HMPREF3016_04210 [Rothia sp. HMSC065D02]
MRSILNSPLEHAIRVLMILVEVFPEKLDLNRLVLFDHSLLHSSDFGGPDSLHPPVPIRVGELGVKRQLIQDGLEVLIRAGLAHIESRTSGLYFGASESAEGFAGLLETQYAHDLSERASWVVEYFKDMDEESMRESVQKALGHWSEELENVQLQEDRNI